MVDSERRPPTSDAFAHRLAASSAAREVVPSDPRLSARWHMHSVPGPYSRWNYHPEYEVHLIRYGAGRYIVGDRIDNFSAGQLVLVGSNLPHHWISDLEPGEILHDRDVVFQFHPDWIRQCRAHLPELVAVEPLLKKSARGIEFSGETARRGADELQLIGQTAGPERLQHIFGLLAVLAAAPDAEHHTLAKEWLPPLDDEHAADIIDRAFGYIMENLVDDVRLTTAAKIIGMSDSAFSRYFKRVTGRTFRDTVSQLRLSHACKLLAETDLPVSVIYHRVGYTNLSNFNRQFRLRYNATPSEFRHNNRAQSPPNTNRFPVTAGTAPVS